MIKTIKQIMWKFSIKILMPINRPLGEYLFQGAIKTIPAGRLGNTNDDLAPSVLFMLSDGAQYTTGKSCRACKRIVESFQDKLWTFAADRVYTITIDKVCSVWRIGISNTRIVNCILKLCSLDQPLK